MNDLNPATRTRIMAVLFFGVLMGALDIAIVGPALPVIQRTFSVDDRSISWIFTIYMLCYVVGSPLMGRLSDRLGRRSIYVLDVALFAAGSLMVALAPSFQLLLIGRAVQALGAGGIFPVASAVIGDVFPADKRGSALGMIGAVFGVAFLLGPLLGAVLLPFSWQWLFLINLPIAAVVIAAAWRYLPSTRKEHPAPLDWAGMVMISVFLTCLTYGIASIDKTHLATSLAQPKVWTSLLVALIAAPVLWQIELRAAEPVVRPSLFSTRQVVLACLFAVGAGLGEGSMVFLSKMAIEAKLVADVSQASFVLMPVVLGMAFGAPMAGKLLDRIGSRPVVIGGLALLTAGFFSFRFVATSIIPFLIAATLVGFGLASLLGAPLRYILLAEARSEDRASSQALLTTFTSVGQLLSGAIVGSVAASVNAHGASGFEGYAQAFMVLAAFVAVLFLLGFGLQGRAAEQAKMQAQDAPGVH